MNVLFFIFSHDSCLFYCEIFQITSKALFFSHLVTKIIFFSFFILSLSHIWSRRVQVANWFLCDFNGRCKKKVVSLWKKKTFFLRKHFLSRTVNAANARSLRDMNTEKKYERTRLLCYFFYSFNIFFFFCLQTFTLRVAKKTIFDEWNLLR